MKRMIIGFVVLLSGHIVNAQDASVRSLSKIEAGLGGVGLGYEAKLSKRLTIDVAGGIGGVYVVKEGLIEYSVFRDDRWRTALYASVNPRFYYNLEKRVASEKDISNNSANYLGVKVKAAFGDKLFNAVLINGHWGLQRSLGKSKKWLINTHAGVGYITDTWYWNTIYPSIDFKLAYIL